MKLIAFSATFVLVSAAAANLPSGPREAIAGFSRQSPMQPMGFSSRLANKYVRSMRSPVAYALLACCPGAGEKHGDCG